MRSKLLILFLLAYLKHAVSQTPALDFYNAAVKEYNVKNYRSADSLFTLSNKLEPHKDTYFSRALCRGKMANKDGYCEDLAYASYLGDAQATKLFLRSCGKIDSGNVVYKSVNGILTRMYSGIVKYTYGDSTNIIFNPYKSNSVALIVEESAEFPGGIQALSAFIQKNLNYPEKARERHISDRAYLRFTIHEDGSIHDIILLKEMPNCTECAKEAMRVISIMPKWKPAKIQGKAVKCYFNMPISFKIQQ